MKLLSKHLNLKWCNDLIKSNNINLKQQVMLSQRSGLVLSNKVLPQTLCTLVQPSMEVLFKNKYFHGENKLILNEMMMRSTFY